MSIVVCCLFVCLFACLFGSVWLSLVWRVFLLVCLLAVVCLSSYWLCFVPKSSQVVMFGMLDEYCYVVMFLLLLRLFGSLCVFVPHATVRIVLKCFEMLQELVFSVIHPRKVFFQFIMFGCHRSFDTPLMLGIFLAQLQVETSPTYLKINAKAGHQRCSESCLLDAVGCCIFVW